MSDRFVSLSDYQDANGRVDYDRYYAAQVANGEKCQTCRGFIAVFGTGSPRNCFACDELEKKPHFSIEHDVLIRCPSCRHLFKGPQTGIDYNRGYIDVYCPSCEHDFEVDTEVKVSFRSPRVCEHEWETLPVDQANVGTSEEWFDRCRKCKAERSTETPRAEVAK